MKRINTLVGLMGLALFAGSVRGGTVAPSDPGLSSETAGTQAFTAPSIGGGGADGNGLNTTFCSACAARLVSSPGRRLLSSGPAWGLSGAVLGD